MPLSCLQSLQIDHCTMLSSPLYKRMLLIARIQHNPCIFNYYGCRAASNADNGYVWANSNRYVAY
ncbi:MAG: hypothetical protein NVS4B11_28930 [Ktedonobacteraceae bacterium]